MTRMLLLLALIAWPALADTRHASTATAFRKLHPCPATQKIQRTCPGYVIDHVIPLCAGGADAVANLQWQTRAESYRKDVQERAQCRALRRDQ